MNWSLLSRVVTLWPLIIGAVHAVEAVSGGLKGRDKQDAAVVAVRAMATAVEGASGRELLTDTEVEAAVRASMDAYVALSNIIARKRAAQAAP